MNKEDKPLSRNSIADGYFNMLHTNLVGEVKPEKTYTLKELQELYDYSDDCGLTVDFLASLKSK